MRKATKIDKDKVVDILSRTFDNNPGVNWMLRKGGNHNTKIRSLVNYAFIKALLREGVYISSNEKGIALCYRHNYKVFSITEILLQIKFALISISIKNIVKVLKRESYRKSKRPKSGDYLYFWFLGVLPDGNEAAFELKNAIFKHAIQYNIPIYLETAVARNQHVYERFGFKTYHYWEDKKENIEFWFMKWEPEC